MNENVVESSGRTISKFAVPDRWKYVVRHSITNSRFGGLPITVVKIPSLVSSVRRSPRYGISERSKPLIASGVHASEGRPPLDVLSCRVPLSLT